MFPVVMKIQTLATDPVFIEVGNVQQHNQRLNPYQSSNPIDIISLPTGTLNDKLSKLQELLLEISLK